MVRCGEGFLARPFSIHGVHGTDVLLLYNVWEEGRGTQWLAGRGPGDEVAVFGPLGNGFSVLPRARKLLLAEREVISCGEELANQACHRFDESLHHNARFALHMGYDQAWPFGKEIRAQCGGVLGLKEALGAGVIDVAMLVAEGRERYGGIDKFPYSEIMRAVVHYEPRRKRGT